MTRVVLLGTALVLLLSGGISCGGGPSDSSRPGSSANSSVLSGTVTVLAAASLTETFMALGEHFQREHPATRLQFSFAASSELASQIVNGAPADVFAAASSSTMHQVVVAGAVAGKPAVFARNRLQIAVPVDNPGDVTRLADFARRELAIALCAPEVPCGAAAVRALESAGIIPSVDTLEPDVKSALTKVELGEVDAALVYRTDVQAAGGRVTGIDFPQAVEAVNNYPIAVLADAPNPAAGRAFVALVTSSAGRRLLADAGFQQP
ncbi:MAG: molybdate ABC transporter substrate-binding protein [Sporichthyaceae bacterium]|nr:molybdate ABC transporter substrate-binding protein [Sporichthyaceae bacterium]